MIDLPTTPAPANVEIGLLHFGTSTTPPLGGPTQTIERLGTRHKISVTMPPMENKEHGRIFTSRLRKAKTRGGIRMALPLGGFDPGDPGAPKIRIPNETGSVISLKDFSPNYEFKEGQWFSILTDGVHYLYSCEADGAASNAGVVNLQIHPMIRTLHQLNDPCFFHQPMIEGKVQGQDWQWSLSVEHHTGIQFEIYERK